MNIDTLQAGPELDALVAEKVMGWRRVGSNKWFYRVVKGVSERGIHEELTEVECTDGAPAPHFSTDLDKAWSVVLMMRGFPSGAWSLWEKSINDGRAFGSERTDSIVPVDVCRAALKAIGLEGGALKYLPARFKNLNEVFWRLPELHQKRLINVINEYATADTNMTKEESFQVAAMINRIVLEGLRP